MNVTLGENRKNGNPSEWPSEGLEWCRGLIGDMNGTRRQYTQ